MPLAPGDKLGPYEILAAIGSGGMGEVYKARDTRLDRIVAIKVSKTEFSERFEREARAVAALNHPHICQLYDVVISRDAPNYLVMEFVEGAPIVYKEKPGPLPLDQALKYAAQICDALDAAHKKNITHRDLKPANILVTKAGVKLLDFGLAKFGTEKTGPVVKTDDATMTMALTGKGEILGTLLYMSPEQVNGQDAGPRSDIFSFGLVLYEILTGKRAFAGATPASVIAAILERPAPSVADVAPPALDRVLKRCLEKDPENRWQSASDLKVALELVSVSVGQAVGQVSDLSSHKQPHWPIAAAITFALALAAVSFLHFREKPPVKEMTRFEVLPPPGATSGVSPTVSPDGRKIAFTAPGADRKAMLWIRSLDAEEAHPLAGTEDVIGPFWSPDSRSIAFGAGGKLKRIEAAGGPVQVVCDAPSFNGGAWTADNRILFGTLGPLQIVPAAGGMPKPVTAMDSSRKELVHEDPAMLPDGQHFLYSRFSIPYENGGVYIGSLDANPEKQSANRLLPDLTNAVYVPSPGTRDTPGDTPGYLLFVRGVSLSSPDGTLMAQPFDPKRMGFMGDAVPIAEHANVFSASPTGVLAFENGRPQANRQLTWYDRKGSVLSTVGDVGEYQAFALSPDESRFAYNRGTDLWLFRFAQGGLSTKFTIGNPAFSAVWSADNASIVFSSIRGSGWGIYRKASNMSGQEELLYQSPDPKVPSSWTHTGKYLMYDDISSDGKGSDIWLLPAEGSAGDRKPVSFLRTEFNEQDAQVSPDGRWVVYSSNRSSKEEVYVLPFDESNPAASAAGGLHQISKDGGGSARWTKDGKEIVYRAADGYLTSVEISVAGGAFQIGKTQQLFKPPDGPGDVTRDGTRFLIAAPPASTSATPASRPYHVVVNWTELLKR